MKKKYLVIGIVALLFCVILITMKLYLKSRQSIPLFPHNQIYFGMTPTEALLIIGTPDTVEYQICDTPDSRYVYMTSVTENEAEVECIYLKNRKLWQMNIIWSLESCEAATELYHRIFNAIYAKYSIQKNLLVDTVSSDEGMVTTMSIGNGATGTIYTIYIEDCEVRVRCINDNV